MHDDITLPSLELLNEHTNFLKMYDTLNLITDYTKKEDVTKKNSVVAVLNKNKQEFLYTLLHKHNIQYEGEGLLTYIEYFYSPVDDLYTLEFTSVNDNEETLQDQTPVLHSQIINFLFDAVMNGVVTKIEEKYIYDH